MKIAARLALMFSALSLVPLAISGALMYLRFQDGQEQAAYRSLRTLAAHKQARFEQWIDDNVRSIEELSRRPAIRTFTESMIEFERAGFRQDYFRDRLRDHHLLPMTESYPDLREVFLADARNGKKLASSDAARVGRFVADQEYFLTGKSRTWVQSLHYPLTLDRVSMTIATPVIDDVGNAIAVLAAHLDLDAIAAIIQQGFEASNSLDSYLINRFSMFVTPGRFAKDASIRGSTHTTGIERCLGGESGEANYRDYRGVPVLGSFRWMERWELCLLVEMDETEALAQASSLRNFVVFLIFGVALVVASLIGFVSRQVSRPIIQVVEAAEKIGRGNLDVRLPSRGDGEIGRLFDGVNQMAENLGSVTASRDDLDREVEQKKRAVDSLAESERRLNTLLSNLPGMAYRCLNTPEWTMKFTSEGCKALTGYEPRQLIDNAEISYAELTHPADREHLWKVVQDAIENGQQFEAEYRLRTAEGDWRWVWEKGRAVSAPGIKPEILEGFVHDITERQRLAMELQQAQKMELLGQVTGGVAHDFNNLLGVILGYSSLARANLPADSEKIAHHLDHISRAGQRARDIVAQMLAFSRGESSEDEVIDLRARLGDEIVMIRSTLPASIGFEIDLEEHVPAIVLQPGQLNQVLMNLCINARDAMQSKGTITIRLRHACDVDAVCTVTRQRFHGEFVELSVSDTGPGLSFEQIDRIFDPFFTTKPIGKGSGLGLAVVDGIVRSHGGHIVVENRAGEGATFRLFFPIAGSPAPEPGTGEQDIPDTVEGAGKRVMIVDDESSLAEYVAEFLESCGYDPVALSSSEEALDIFARDPEGFDLLVTDQTMPGLTGLELVENIRTIRPDLPVILCTGFSEFVNAETAQQKDIGFLAKPIDPDGLLREVARRIG